MNQTLVNQSVAMLIESGLPKSFWMYTIDTSAFLTGRSPTTHWRHIKIFQDIKVIENAEPMLDFLENF